jgi:2,4-dienoyl-CoA reductase-like NADH-dependent reductase (Old Yellow Enzyme family)
MIAVGRALLQDPDWAQKIRQGRHNELADWDSASLAKLY